MVYGTYNELVNGVYKPTYNWGAPPCMICFMIFTWLDRFTVYGDIYMRFMIPLIFIHSISYFHDTSNSNIINYSKLNIG